MNGGATRELRVVAVNGDDDFCETVPNELLEQGFGVTSFSGGLFVLAALGALSAADLIVLDRGIPTIQALIRRSS